MEYRPLGRTGLQTSVLGLGTGTRFGDPKINPPAQATRLVRAALDLGINYIDTAAMYLEAEAMLGEALAGVTRDRFILATKFFPAEKDGTPIAPAELRASVERSLRRLKLDTIDVLQIHGLRPHWLAPVLAQLGGELEALHREGKYRFLGVAETIVEDPTHAMVPAAVATGKFTTVLAAYSLLSPWAEATALDRCAQHGVGVVAMVAVRRTLRDPERLAAVVRAAHARGELTELSADRPLDWLLDAHTPDLAAAGYRFAVAHPAVSCVLAGTLNLEHLQANLAAVCAPPMPAESLARLRRIFLQTNPRHWIPYDL
ncbi:MAG: aldo/keto reductase [Opitutus sp.]|nr:aldo/keto reductase [Opitutus sp.]